MTYIDIISRQYLYSIYDNTVLSGMNYSTTGFQLVLTRKMSFYVVTYYLPSGLFVVVSWIRSAECRWTWTSITSWCPASW